MIEIKYGRDEATGKLQVNVGGKQRVEGAEKSVPKNVSREHVQIQICDDSSIVLKNLNIENDTFVNGTAVEQKKIKKGDIIELGSDHYRLEWKVIEPLIPLFVDISPLHEVWDSYQKEKMDYQIKEKRFNVLKSSTGMLTMLAIMVSFADIKLSGGISLRIAFYALAFGISFILNIKSWKDASSMPKKYMELDKRIKRQYLCPNPKCNHFMGLVDYEVLAQNRKCPHCGALYIKHSNY